MTASVQFFIGDPCRGEPEVEVESEWAHDVVPGALVWDSQYRRFCLVDACPDHPRAGWTTLKYSDGSVEDYPPRTELGVAVNAVEGDAFNRLMAYRDWYRANDPTRSALTVTARQQGYMEQAS